MGPLVVLLLLLSLSTLWLFFRFQPYVADTKVKALATVNRLFLGLAVILAVLGAIRVFTAYAPSPSDPALLPGVAASYAMGLLALTLAVGFVLRNFVIFRRATY